MTIGSDPDTLVVTHETLSPQTAVSDCAGPRLGVGVLVFWRERFLLIQRGQEPLRGRWTLPGGKVEKGETLLHALERELLEECAIRADHYVFLDYFEFIDNDNIEFSHHYVVLDFIAEYASGELQARSDIDSAGWFLWDDLNYLDTTPATREIVTKALHLRSK
jgi:8-oxo-dGTP diphosphatase